MNVCIYLQNVEGAVVVVIVCTQCLSPLTLRVQTPFMGRCTQYNIMW